VSTFKQRCQTVDPALVCHRERVPGGQLGFGWIVRNAAGAYIAHHISGTGLAWEAAYHAITRKEAA
jgi:hypothetical protein